MSGSIKNTNAPVDASFKFVDYKFTEASINLGALNENDNLVVDFRPTGEYNPATGVYKLSLGFVGLTENSETEIINVRCEALFVFRESLEFEQLPTYFYANSTAILYPYIRAFVSTLSVQANYPSIVLPTLNISALADGLKTKTVINNRLAV